MMPHVVLPDYDYWIWMDGNQQLAEDPWKLVAEYLEDGVNIASYKHPDRECVFQELDACLKMRKDDPTIMQYQIDRYKDEGYPAKNGLTETTVVLRRNCDETQNLDEAWWHEIQRGSLRDQLSLDYVLWKHKIKLNHVRGRRDKPVHFKYHPHR
jgi:hypothetical protein